MYITNVVIHVRECCYRRTGLMSTDHLNRAYVY